MRRGSLMHKRVEERVWFVCEDCGLEAATKGVLVSHRRTWFFFWRGGGGSLEDGLRE